MNGFDRNCYNLLLEVNNCHSKNAFLSAFNHLDKAENLLDLDPSMCVFRAITAEEEAATGLMLCLKERKYNLSDKLKHKDHVYKSAVYPFLEIIKMTFAQLIRHNKMKIGLHISSEDGKRRLKSYHTLPDTGLCSWPQPPLNFSMKIDGEGDMYAKEIDHYLKEVGANDIVQYVKKLANARNEVLYANHAGIPEVDIDALFLTERKAKVISMLKVYLLIKPYSEKQLFVQQNIYTYLKVLNVISKEFGDS